MEHDALIQELPEMENWPMPKRLKLAKKRRREQLRKWREREDATDDEAEYELLTESGPKVKFQPSVALLESTARNDTAGVIKLLDDGVDPNLCNSDGLTALHQCCIEDCPKLAEILLSYGANMNAQDIELWTPLHAASRCGHLDLVKLLISQGADIAILNSDNQMPYEISETSFVLNELQKAMQQQGYTAEKIEEVRNAVPNQMLQDVRDCVENNLELDLEDENGATILHIAAANGFYQVAELLLENGANVDAQDDEGWTPLHGASCWGQYEMIILLVENGASLEMRTNDNETPVMLAGDQNITLLLHDLRTKQLEKEIHKKSHQRSRTYSSSSRGHSVRRDSMKVKSSFSKRDAMAEGRHMIVDEVEEGGNGFPRPIGSDSDPSVFSSGSYEHNKSSLQRKPTGRIPEGERLAAENQTMSEDENDPNEVEHVSADPIPRDTTITTIRSNKQLVETPEKRERSTTFNRRKINNQRGNDCCNIL